MSREREQFWTLLQARLEAFFRDQYEGWDIPPAQLYRLEGVIDAGLSLGLVSQQDVREQLLLLAERYLSKADAELYRQDDDIVLHLRMKTAPVYPSNSSSV